MDMAYWKWREIIDNAEEGIKFHRAFGEMLGGFKNACVQFLNSRRADMGLVELPAYKASADDEANHGWYGKSVHRRV
jgi:programmed cell death 6-interacting protein